MSLKVKKARVFSAKLTPSQQERSRPFSGVSNHAFHRQELIENTYASQSVQPSRAVSARPTRSGQYLSGGQQLQKQVLRTMIKPSRQKQQMAEQILSLKQTINKLVEELSHERGKVEMIKRKNSKYSKMLSMQFANEQQWGTQTVSNHLVTGIKTMYDQLKQKYEIKCKEHDELLTKALTTNYLELNVYIGALENSNKELKKKLEAFHNHQLLLPVSNQSQRQANAYMIAQLKQDGQKQLEKLKDLQSLLKKSQENGRDMQKKIDFLQKLIIEKDNNIHALQGKNKELFKQNSRVKKELATVTVNLSALETKHQDYREFSAKLQSEVSERHKVEIQVLTNKKDQSIQALEKSNNYLQEIVGQLRRNNTQLNSEIQNIKEEAYRFRLHIHQKATQDPADTHRTANIQHKADHSKDPLVFTRCTDHQGNRIPQKADRKHHEAASKKRKVDPSDVMEAIQLIKYKMVSQSISLEQLITMFDYDPSLRLEEDPQWSKQYVSMRQIKTLLVNKPFNLNTQDAVLLARYLIEDVHQQHVYCDQLNQNDRSIVKSIMKNLLQPFKDFGLESARIQKETSTIMVQYASNLQSALTTLEPSGFISHSKFSNVLRSLGIEVSQAVEACLIAKMAVHSDSIKKLPFRVLF